ncbi:RrF2 family transcriptional regulator [Massilia yuzhufengensis]|uniref:DNA-binding transcriptional regulator, IscR family n=1 Tax=Massilia yuzhufengensis TaxID=1164594 RepID=A0A1I1WQX4_9BURK|nr:Rrf2 family transcriptional regulator [Massilia yuzhufengensis]SFD96778.1 DNA-binding transcriptional regulator, IscR family [Massilia yuzhufengensis]
MRRDSKLSSVLHVLLHLAHGGRPMTSEEMAGFLDTNPVLVRRVLAGLRERGYLSANRGHGGGWSLTCDLKAVTLRDIYDAVGAPPFFAMGNRSEKTTCLVEQVVNASLAEAFHEAEALLVARLGHVSLADLSQEFNRRFADHARSHPPTGEHLEHPQHKPV